MASATLITRPDGTLGAKFTLADGRRCVYSVEVHDGAPTFTGLEIVGEPISARSLRAIPVGAHLAQLHATLARMASEGRSWVELVADGEHIPPAPGASGEFAIGFGAADWDRQMLESAGVAHVTAPRKRRGRPGRPDIFYARLAASYVEALMAGSRSPTADVAKNFLYSPEHVRDAIHTARERGLLSRPPGKGRPGGQLTERAKAMLDGGATSESTPEGT